MAIDFPALLFGEVTTHLKAVTDSGITTKSILVFKAHPLPGVSTSRKSINHQNFTPAVASTVTSFGADMATRHDSAALVLADRRWIKGGSVRGAEVKWWLIRVPRAAKRNGMVEGILAFEVLEQGHPMR